VKPILVYRFFEKREKSSWRPWGGIQSRRDLEEEVERINNELKDLRERADFQLNILPLSTISNIEEAEKIDEKMDVVLIYPSSGSSQLLNKLSTMGKWTLFFIRHRSGPVYLWYEIIHPRFLRNHTDQIVYRDIGIDDIVIDDYQLLLKRLRALYGLKNTLNSKIIAIDGPSGWGYLGYINGPYLARKKWNLDIITVTYRELEKRLRKAKSNQELVRLAEREAREYLDKYNVNLKTDFKFVVNAFILYYVFKDLLKEYNANAITVKECMGTIMPIAETTACLVLSMLNDDGYLAFCESDFVVIPSGILLHYISSKPVFLNDPTTPHHGIVTLAHCTAPRKMNGKDFEKADIVTHFESDYGAAPKVYMKKGQIVTVIDPDFEGRKWLIFRGRIIDNPSMNICRSQVDIEIDGDWYMLLKEMRGFHWMLCYGDYLEEVEYALKKIGIEVLNCSKKLPKY